MEMFFDIVGWSGSIAVVAAYGLNSYEKISTRSLLFLLLNLLGGLCLIVYSVYYTAYANTFINVVWVAIAIPALVNSLRKKKSKH